MDDTEVLVRACIRMGRFFLSSILFSALVALCVILYMKGYVFIVCMIMLASIVFLGFGVCFFMEKSLANEKDAIKYVRIARNEENDI